MAQAAVPYIKPKGSIVMTGSVTGLLGNKDLLDYSMTKLCALAFAAPYSARHSRERGCAGTGLDASQPGRQIRRARSELRRRHYDETSRPAGGNRASLRVPGRAHHVELHHGRDYSDPRRLYRRLANALYKSVINRYIMGAPRRRSFYFRLEDAKNAEKAACARRRSGRSESWVCKPGLRQGACRFRAHPDAAAKRGICNFAELRQRGCRRGEHLRFSRQRQGGKPGGDRRGDGGEW